MRFADGFDHPDTIAFGLEAPQLAVIVGGALAAWGLLNAPLPGVLAGLLAAMVALVAGVVGAGRWAGRPLLTWAWVAGRYWIGPRRGGVLAADAGGGSDAAGGRPATPAPTSPSPGGVPPGDDEPAWARWLRDGGARMRGRGRDVAPAPAEPPHGERQPLEGQRGGGTEFERDGPDVAPLHAAPVPTPVASRTGEPARDEKDDDGSPDATPGLLPVDPPHVDERPAAIADALSPMEAQPPAPPVAPPTPVEMWLAALDTNRVREPAAPPMPVPREPAPASRPPARATPSESAAPPPTLGALVRGFVARVRGLGPPGAEVPPSLQPAIPEAPEPPPSPSRRANPGRTVELDRPPLVLLPSPAAPPEDEDVVEEGSHADEDDPVDEPSLAPVIPLLTHRGDGLDDELMLELAEGDSATAAVERAPAAAGSSDARAASASGASGQKTPVFVGATRRITFFSLNGGSGRTTLATEVACVLAARGRHRPNADGPSERLRVALVDLDLRSSNTALRLGVPRPTLWDYLLATGDDADDVRRFLVHHPSGLRALLGPPKPLSTTAAAVEPARIAEIVHQLERDGCHFIVFDVGSDLGAVPTWVLSQVHDIYVVITPTGSGLQDAYRTTEALRRLGLGHKLRYVVNRAKGHVDIGEVMGDLGGRVTASIPYDQRLEDAENTHTIASLRGSGPAAEAILRLARTIYPSLEGGGTRRGLWRRRAG